MLISTGKKIHVYIWIKIPINEQATQRVGGIDTQKNIQRWLRDNQFKWIPLIPIMYQANRSHPLDSETGYEEASFHINKENEDIPECEEE